MNALKNLTSRVPTEHLRIWMLVPALALMLTACSVEQTEEGELPDVDVQGGNLPEYDVDPARVDIDTETNTVRVPDIDVEMQEKQIETPDIDIITEKETPE